MNILLRQKLISNEVIDLFSGCGGLALGFANEGFTISTGADIDESAKNTASYNLHWKLGKSGEHLNLDISNNDTDVFSQYAGNSPIVIGGPPCQAFSLAGRAKLKSLGEDRDPINDRRGYLYIDFIRHALNLKASAIVMENVPEATNYSGKNIPELVCDELNNVGYTAYWTLLNSADFGVPQTRERVFVIAIKGEITDQLDLPLPTHRPINLQDRKRRKFNNTKYYRPSLEPSSNLPYWNTVSDALSDLPTLFTSHKNLYRLNKFNMALPYNSKPQGVFQKTMRENNTLGNLVTGHSFRKTLRDFPIFSKMKQGHNYLDAQRIALKMLDEVIGQLDVEEGSDKYEEIRKGIVPPYSTDKFFSKWKKLREDLPSHTLVAHLSVDSYSHIHPWEPRGISVREAARLQSFPDDFLFNCSMGDAFKQIGNAVPPMLSQAIARTLKPYILTEVKNDNT